MEKLKTFLRPYLKKDLPGIRPGDTVRVYQKIPARIAPANISKVVAGAGGKEGDKERTQTFEGLVLARKHGKEMGATITVRKVVSGIGVEKIFPIHSPTIEKIEILKRGKVRRAKLYYLREAKGRKARLKKEEFAEVITEEERPEEIKEEPPKISAEQKSEIDKEAKTEPGKKQ
jgi:large subunit ribosomal protein L19